jgi:hypothetical protein
MGRYSVKMDMTLDQMLEELSEAAFRTASPYVHEGAAGAFREKMTESLRRVLQKDMIWSDICGLAVVCTDSTPVEPWSEDDEGRRKKSA